MASELPRVVSKRELLQIVPYSPQHILRLEKRGEFPPRIVIGPRRVGWRLADIEAWLTERARGSVPARKPERT